MSFKFFLCIYKSLVIIVKLLTSADFKDAPFNYKIIYI